MVIMNNKIRYILTTTLLFLKRIIFEKQQTKEVWFCYAK